MNHGRCSQRPVAPQPERSPGTHHVRSLAFGFFSNHGPQDEVSNASTDAEWRGQLQEVLQQKASVEAIAEEGADMLERALVRLDKESSRRKMAEAHARSVEDDNKALQRRIKQLNIDLESLSKASYYQEESPATAAAADRALHHPPAASNGFVAERRSQDCSANQ
jgi:hypothetical protein